MSLYVIIADGVFDQVCEEPEDMARESRELRDLGHRVKVVKFNSWDEVYDFEELMIP